MTLLALALAAAAACAGAAGGPFPGAASPAPARTSVTTTDAVAWSPDRRLTWADFRGRPELESPVAAVTTYALSWESDCSPDGFRFRVTSVFLPEQSWVKPEVVGRTRESDWTLAHEQTHFDLSEIHARKMRRELSRLVRPCRFTEEQLAAALDPIVREDGSQQQRYDRETDHGLDRAQQARWDDEVRRELSSLDRYADNGIGWDGGRVRR